jgi:vitamin B12/bleomycin/antimicrobial peptide transport system ATP-binding/permease protein
VTVLISTLATIWRLAAPYFRSEDRWAGRALLAALIAIELAIVGINVMINAWSARFYTALQEYNWDVFVREILVFCALAAAYILVAVYQIYLNQWLQIRWRQWMTRRYLAHWLEAANHYRMQLLGDRADNPDQRIAEDIQLFVERTLRIGVGLLGAIVSLGSFIIILWGLSDQAPLHLFGADWPIPGYLVWAALFYAAIGTTLTHLVGRKLIDLTFNQQRYEADFRFNLVRVREHSEQIALLSGEAAERERLMDRFGNIAANWRRIMLRTRKLIFFTSGYNQISIIFPFVVISPAYFAKRLPLGFLTQTASAFGSVQTALSFFINVYQTLAEWRAVIERLSGFDASIVKSRSLPTTGSSASVAARGQTKDLHVDALDVRLPDGAPLVTAPDVKLAPGERVLVSGPSGSGKSTLFRAIGGIWPFSTGAVVVPEGARVMVVPQKPYLPVASLAAAVAYPSVPGTFQPAAICDVLEAVGLPALVPRLAEEAHWERMLSPGEQQRLAIARAILHAPDFLFLDEATASLDEPAEAMLYRLLHERIPRTTIVSIGHRSTLRAFHDRRLTLAPDGQGRQVREAALDTSG